MDTQLIHSKRFFDIEKNVKEYIQMCEGMDGRFLIDILKNQLEPNSTILELGMGPGTDLDILGETYQVTGSDNSQVFLDIYKQKNPNAHLLLLDAITLNTERKFDCIYSNKVLHHLSKSDLAKSFRKQKDLLNSNGLLFHTFWKGVKMKKYQDLNFIQYEVNQLIEIVKPDYRIVEVDLYEQMNIDDSIYLVLRRR